MEAGALIGIGAIVLGRARVGAGALIAARAVVLPEPRCLPGFSSPAFLAASCAS